MKRKIKNSVHVLVVVGIASILVIVNPQIANKELLSYEKIIDLQLVLLGIMTAVTAFIYSIVRGIQDRYKNDDEKDEIIKEQLPKALKSIDLDIKRVLVSLIITILLYMIIDIDIPVFKEGMYLNKLQFSTSIKLAILIYIICAFVDMILAVLKLYHLDID